MFNEVSLINLWKSSSNSTSDFFCSSLSVTSGQETTFSCLLPLFLCFPSVHLFVLYSESFLLICIPFHVFSPWLYLIAVKSINGALI